MPNKLCLVVLSFDGDKEHKYVTWEPTTPHKSNHVMLVFQEESLQAVLQGMTIEFNAVSKPVFSVSADGSRMRIDASATVAARGGFDVQFLGVFEGHDCYAVRDLPARTAANKGEKILHHAFTITKVPTYGERRALYAGKDIDYYLRHSFGLLTSERVNDELLPLQLFRFIDRRVDACFPT